MAKETPRIPIKPLSGVSVVDLAAKQQQIEALHYRLMAIYVYIIETVSRPGRLPKRAKSSGGVEERPSSANDQRESLRWYLWLYRLRPVTRNLVYSHVKGKLDELRAAYAQIEQLVSYNDAHASLRSWLKDTQDSLSQFSETLNVKAPFRRVMAALWPLIVAVVVLAPVWGYLLRLFNDRFRSQPIRGAELIVMIVVIYTAVRIAIAVDKKRKLFLSPISMLPDLAGAPLISASKSIAAENVYEAEDHLFESIGRYKRPEFALDTFAIMIACLAAMIYFGSYAVHWISSSNLFGEITNVGSVIFIALIGFTYLVRGLRRTPR